MLNFINPKEVKVVYFGSVLEVAQALGQIFDLKAIVCEQRLLNQAIFDYANWLACDFYLVNQRSDIDALALESYDLGVSCIFGIIFKNAQIQRFDHGIWNIHFGKLPHYRGRHPITWAIINGEKEIGLSIHSIDESIDRGILLAEAYVQRSLYDTERDIEQKIYAKIGQDLLCQAYNSMLTSNHLTHQVEEGTYHKSLTGGLGEIRPSEYTSQELFNIVQSQAAYKGICIDGKYYDKAYFYHPQLQELYDALPCYTKVTCKDNKRLILIAKA